MERRRLVQAEALAFASSGDACVCRNAARTSTNAPETHVSPLMGSTHAATVLPYGHSYGIRCRGRNRILPRIRSRSCWAEDVKGCEEPHSLPVMKANHKCLVFAAPQGISTENCALRTSHHHRHRSTKIFRFQNIFSTISKSYDTVVKLFVPPLYSCTNRPVPPVGSSSSFRFGHVL